MNAISASNLCKVYQNGKKALTNLSIEVQEGEIFSLLGPNGAGKSTLINILTTFLQPTSGKILIMGKDLCRTKVDTFSYFLCSSKCIHR